MTPTGTRQTAEQRREALIEAAMIEFAETGLHGTSTDDIARRAGISQPYLFRLFRTKRDLFLATVEHCFARTERGVHRGRRRRHAGASALQAMGLAYCALLADRTKLMMQMQAYAACDDDEVRATVSRCYERPLPHVGGAGAGRPRAAASLVCHRHVPERDGGDGRPRHEGPAGRES